MQMSEKFDLVIQALVHAQAEIQNPKTDANNPHFRSTYATLENVIDVVKPILAKHKLGLMFDDEPQSFTLNAVLIHECGQWIKYQFQMNFGKGDMHGIGGAHTYGRRMAIKCILNLGEEDDDGNSTSDLPQTKTTPNAQKRPQTPPKVEDKPKTQPQTKNAALPKSEPKTKPLPNYAPGAEKPADVPFDDIPFPTLDDAPPPEVTEEIDSALGLSFDEKQSLTTSVARLPTTQEIMSAVKKVTGFGFNEHDMKDFVMHYTPKMSLKHLTIDELGRMVRHFESSPKRK